MHNFQASIIKIVLIIIVLIALGVLYKASSAPGGERNDFRIIPENSNPGNTQSTPVPERPSGTNPATPSKPVEEGGNSVFCTMDAKMCPDGSYVGRIAPNCEFAACPGN